jgi:hypothetical protein
VGLEDWIIAVGSTVLALVVLRLVPYVERRLLHSKEDTPNSG